MVADQERRLMREDIVKLLHLRCVVVFGCFVGLCVRTAQTFVIELHKRVVAFHSCVARLQVRNIKLLTAVVPTCGYQLRKKMNKKKDAGVMN